MRGTLAVRVMLISILGIIPAYAGNTGGQGDVDIHFGDHPRICGEHLGVSAVERHHPGSSPHMRGTPVALLPPLVSMGIIPAYAGNTHHFLAEFYLARDHPRICGEHICSGSYVITVPGSSPHMRGTRVLSTSSGRNTGIIPAYAGNTVSIQIQAVIVWDHPRICGEHFMDGINMCATPGSSPHMRGTLKGMCTYLG